MSDSSATWYYMADGDRVGPVPESLLRSLLWNGELPWDSMVWSQGWQEWSPASAIPALASEEQLPSAAPPSLPQGVKSRHGCFVAWLVFAFIANSLAALLFLLATVAVASGINAGQPWVPPVYLVLEVVQIACLVALVRWKRWGFWGLVAVSFAAGVFNSFVLGRPGSLIIAGIGPVLWYGTLQIGGYRAAWKQLE